MTVLTLFSEDRPDTPTLRTDDRAAIADHLSGIGVRFERWEAERALSEQAPPAEVLAAYAGAIARLQDEGGYATADVVSLTPDHPQKAALREKFLDEHRHAEDEVRFFVRGAGQFYLHTAGQVFALRCEAGDLLSVPAGITHWFDTGPEPSFVAIRLFTDPAGWVAEYTGTDLASRFPTMDQLA